ncbi:uncharacterized protein V6R79_014686 [Siganus canaliculatus]
MVKPNSSVTTYGLPTEIQVGNGSSMSDEMAKTRRVQQQVQMRLAQKSTLPRQNGSAPHYAMSEFGGGSSTMKYQTYNPSVHSKSTWAYSGSKTMGPRVTQRSGFSSQSAGPDLAQFHRISIGGGGLGGGGGGAVAGGGGGGYYREDMRSYQGTYRQPSRMEPALVNPWVDNSDAGSMISNRDATFNRQYAQSTSNGYTTQMRQSADNQNFAGSMHRSLSGTLSRGGGMSGGEVEMVQQQQSFKGPAYRTISRINRKTMQRPMSTGGSIYGGVDMVDNGFMASGLSSASQANLMRQSNLTRAMSIKSMQSVGKGMDIFQGQGEFGASMGNLSGINALDMPTAIQNLSEPEPELQVLGAAYIQHECYNDSDAKNELRQYKGISALVKLFNSDSQEVQRYVTGATRNAIYENMDNKVALIEEGGIPELVKALKEHDDELRKNITGILWNLSSKDTLKQKLARETLPELTDKILIPLAGSGDSIQLSASESEIFHNTTGCLRNLSSVNEKTRQQMRETSGLVESLVNYIRVFLEENKAEDKGVENAVCILRNLSYQLYTEMPPSALMRLEGPTRAQASGKGEAIGCFTPQSRKAKDSKSLDLSTFSEVARIPKGMEWLWHPQIVSLYNRVLHQCEMKATTREAAAGALQNITAGDKRWASVLSRVAVEHERMLPMLLDLLRTNSDQELRSLTGFLRNLSRHARDKGDMATKVVNNLVTKLPADGRQKEPSSEVVVNICGILNNLVASSQLAARDIAFFDGLPKLIGIKNSHDGSPGKTKAAKAAATVLCNMFQYKKLHSTYKNKGFTRPDFSDLTI